MFTLYTALKLWLQFGLAFLGLVYMYLRSFDSLTPTPIPFSDSDMSVYGHVSEGNDISVYVAKDKVDIFDD